MLEGGQNTGQSEEQEDSLEKAESTARPRGPWMTFFSRIREAAKPVWALYIACALALLTVGTMIGTPILNPLCPVSLSGTSLAVGGDGSVLVVDKMRTRVLFLDDKNEIDGIVETGQGVAPVDEVTDVALGDDVAYVAGLTRMEDGKSIASESVSAFSLDGTFLETVWQTSYGEGTYRPIRP